MTATSQRGVQLRKFGATTITHVDQAEGWFDVTLDSVGGRSLVEARKKTSPAGTVIWFGQASHEPITVDFFDWVQGTAGAPIVAFHYEIDDRPLGDDLATLVRQVSEHRLHPEIGALLPWDRTAQVIDDLRERRLRATPYWK